MKKFSLILASLVLFAGASFASPIVKAKKQDQKTEKKETKKSTTKKVDKAPVKKDNKKAADKK